MLFLRYIGAGLIALGVAVILNNADIGARPVEIIKKTVSLFFQEKLWVAVFWTLIRFIVGYTIAVVLASAFGLIIGRYKWAEEITALPISFFRPIPSIAVIPIAMIIFEYGSYSMHFFVVVFAVFWPVLVQVIQGAKDVDKLLIDTGRTLGKSSAQIFFGVIVRAVLPAIFVGARVGLAIALLLTVTTEYIVPSGQGLGILLKEGTTTYDYPTFFSVALVLALLGILADRIFDIVEPLVLPWHAGRTE